MENAFVQVAKCICQSCKKMYLKHVLGNCLTGSGQSFLKTSGQYYPAHNTHDVFEFEVTSTEIRFKIQIQKYLNDL